MARLSAPIVSARPRLLPSLQPKTRRECRSKTTARYRQPLPLFKYVTSPRILPPPPPLQVRPLPNPHPTRSRRRPPQDAVGNLTVKPTRPRHAPVDACRSRLQPRLPHQPSHTLAPDPDPGLLKRRVDP